MALKPQKALVETFFDQRGRSRRKLCLEVNAQTIGLPSKSAVVHDISETGLLLEFGASLAIGDMIDVELSPTSIKLAEVVWVSGNLAGCKFVYDLSSGAISAALLQASFPTPMSDTGFGRSDAKISKKSDPSNKNESEQLSFMTKIWVIFALTSLLWGTIAAMALWIIS